jgi:hypothetical protein
MDTIELADGGLLLYAEAFLPTDLADRYFVELRNTAPWEQKKAAFGRLQPRLTASYCDEGVTYSYAKLKEIALRLINYGTGEGLTQQVTGGSGATAEADVFVQFRNAPHTPCRTALT